MKWKINKGYSDKTDATKDEYWEIVSSWLGLREKQYNSFIAKFFREYMNGQELRKGYSRQLVGTQGTVHYLTLEEYNPEEYSFTVSISTEYLDSDSKYMIIRNKITELESGSRWNIEVSEKKSFWNKLTGGLGSRLDGMFHGHVHFNQT